MRFKQKRRIFMRLSTLKTDESFWYFLLSSDPAGTRTQDPNIKSVMLYRLSYEIIFDVSVKSGANIGLLDLVRNQFFK
jgi:hypothetical protein